MFKLKKMAVIFGVILAGIAPFEAFSYSKAEIISCTDLNTFGWGRLSVQDSGSNLFITLAHNWSLHPLLNHLKLGNIEGGLAKISFSIPKDKVTISKEDPRLMSLDGWIRDVDVKLQGFSEVGNTLVEKLEVSFETVKIKRATPDNLGWTESVEARVGLGTHTDMDIATVGFEPSDCASNH